MKYHKHGHLYITYNPINIQHIHHLYFLLHNRIEKDEPYHPVQKSPLMNNIERNILKYYVFTTRYREELKIHNLK